VACGSKVERSKRANRTWKCSARSISSARTRRTTTSGS
jgi:hypothetical protein